MKSLVIATGVGLALSTAAFAANSNQASTPINPQNNASATVQSQNTAPAEKIKQELQNAGFQDVNVMAEAFVVRAKSKDGDPVVMTIGPHGMTAFEAVNANNASASKSANMATSAPKPNTSNSSSTQ